MQRIIKMVNPLYRKIVPVPPFNNGVENLFSKILRKINVATLLIQCDRKCYCSYCTEKSLFPVGLRLPQCKARNSWRYIFINLLFFKIYIRWTLIK